MKAIAGLLVSLLAFLGCDRDETLRAYGAADRVWTLQELNGAPFPALATLSFPNPGQIAGQAPCNRYFSSMTTPYPWFETGSVGGTRMACPEMGAETAFFAALQRATLSEVVQDTLILSDTDGLSMVFKATE